MLDANAVREAFSAHPVLETGPHQSEDRLAHTAPARELDRKLFGEGLGKHFEDQRAPGWKGDSPNAIGSGVTTLSAPVSEADHVEDLVESNAPPWVRDHAMANERVFTVRASDALNERNGIPEKEPRIV